MGAPGGSGPAALALVFNSDKYIHCLCLSRRACKHGGEKTTEYASRISDEMELMTRPAEIDQALKKVSEGVELFENTYDKMQAATNQAQVGLDFIWYGTGCYNSFSEREARVGVEEPNQETPAAERPNQRLGLQQ
jgi:hypothetical protein